MARKYEKYSPEYREQAAKLVVETSRPIADVARGLGWGETTLGNCVWAYREAHAADEPELPISDRALLRELERRTRELEMENVFLKKVPMTVRGHRCGMRIPHGCPGRCGRLQCFGWTRGRGCGVKASRGSSGSTSAPLDAASSQKSVTRGLEGPLTAAWSAYLRLF